MRKPSGFTVTGPNVEKAVEHRGSGFIFAQKCAELADNDEATFYVRDAKGDSVGYVERQGKTVVTVETSP